ncbi:hypothetical protein EV04_0911 [Prochlorococcus marinus str. LG]|nr:hypothetical protein EV04_0911 [Prochlorococcus marinus str. LG]
MHFDLLLEDNGSCRTWRLPCIPDIDGPSVSATPLLPHKLHWLEREAGAVSGGRGWAKRIVGGKFYGSLPFEKDGDISININSSNLTGRLFLSNNLCQITCFSNFDVI